MACSSAAEGVTVLAIVIPYRPWIVLDAASSVDGARDEYREGWKKMDFGQKLA
jgi:hypothetical protein